MPNLSSRLDTEALQKALTNLSQGDAYTQGVSDLLSLLGLVDDAGQPRHELAGVMLDSLRAHLRDGLTVHIDYGKLLEDSETARLKAITDATPVRVVSVVQAVWKIRREDEDHYLMQYDPAASQFQPLGGKIDADDASPLVALRREMYEELPLADIPDEAQLSLTDLDATLQTTQISRTYGVLTGYTFDYYHVTSASIAVSEDNDTRWISRSEIHKGQTSDGHRVSTILVDGLGWEKLDSLSLTLL